MKGKLILNEILKYLNEPKLYIRSSDYFFKLSDHFILHFFLLGQGNLKKKNYKLMWNKSLSYECQKLHLHPSFSLSV